MYMKNRIISSLIFTFLLILFIPKVYALEVSKSDITIQKGSSGSVELYVNTTSTINRVDFTLIYTTYDIPGNFSVASGLTDDNPNGIKHGITFNEAKTGKILLGTVTITVKSNPDDTAGTISIHTASAKTTSGETIELKNQTINVKVGEPAPVETPKETPKEVDKNLLDKIESKIVKIELKKDTFDYTIEIDDTVEELDLNPVAKDTNTKVEITSQKIAELKDNKIVITTKNGDTEQVYNITVKVKKIDKAEIDNEEFVKDNSYKVKWIVVIVVLSVILAGSIVFNRKR